MFKQKVKVTVKTYYIEQFIKILSKETYACIVKFEICFEYFIYFYLQILFNNDFKSIIYSGNCNM